MGQIDNPEDYQTQPGTAEPLLSSPPKPTFLTSSKSSQSSTTEKSHRNTTLASLLKTWKYDLLLCALSFAAMIALIVLLSTQDGKRQRTWADGTITLNTAISILSTVIRSAIVVPIAAALTQQKWLWYRSSGKGQRLWDYEVFDRASRGVMGSVHLLGITGLRRFASLGAVGVVASIAVGPFSQLLLTIDEKNDAVVGGNLNVTIGRAYRYDAYTSHDTHQTAVTSDKTTFAMVSAIMSGVFAANVTDLPASCPTGDCDWPSVQTLAVCGACETFTPQWELHIKKKDLRATYDHGEYKLAIPATSTPDDKKKRVHFNTEGFPYLTVFQIIELSSYENWRKNTATWDDALHGQECAMWLCAQSYNISVKDGVQTNRIVASTSDTYKTSNYSDDSWISPTSNEYFGASARAFYGIHDQLDETFTGSYNRSWNDARNEIHTSSPVMSALDAYGVSAVVQNVAKSMTNHIRLQVASTAFDTRLLEAEANLLVPLNSTATPEKVDWPLAMGSPAVNDTGPLYVTGTAYSLEPFFHVRWAWITLPALLTLISPIFVLCTIMASQRSGTPIMGSGLRALVGCRVDGDVLGGAEDEAKASKDVRVEMRRDEMTGGWRMMRMEK